MRLPLILVSTLALVACNNSADAQEGSDARAAASRTYDVGSFESVSLGGPYDVVVTVGPAASVRAEGDAEEIERMEVSVEDGGLEIKRRRSSGMNIGFGPNRQVRVHVTVPSLKAAAIGGSGDMKIDKVEGSSFAASIGGSGDMAIGAMRVGQADFSVAGSGGITASGAADRTSVSIAGSGDVALQGLRSRAASVSVVGSGDVRVNAAEAADVSIMGSGDVEVAGGARCSVSKMGSGDVRCG